jgi:hypothetical protein
MNDRRRLVAVSAIATALAAAILLIVGVQTVLGAAGEAPLTVAAPAASGPTAWARWAIIPPGACQVFTHSLGADPEDYIVEMWFKDLDDGLGLNRRFYGTAEEALNFYGATWRHLTTDTIEICRAAQDYVADNIWVRVSIPPGGAGTVYSSAWTDIAQDEVLTFTHGLGITATDLTVRVVFSSASLGIHHMGYGGRSVASLPQDLEGATWQHLRENTVQVYRYPDDHSVEQVQVSVVHADPPNYDSLVDLGGWQFIPAGAGYTFTHNLHWDPTMMLVRAECSSTLAGISHRYAGSEHNRITGWTGAHIEYMTPVTVRGVRHGSDNWCPEMRVRIWKRSLRVHVPLVLRGF